jgi:molybdate transport system substrate-binding protein
VRRLHKLLALVAAPTLVVGLAVGAAEGGDRPTVYAAASLTEVFPRIAPEARFQFAGSNQLTVQIRQGAPADVFASASPVYTQALHREGLIEQPRVFATNTLVLAVPRSNPAKLHTIADLARRPKLQLVVARPTVPVGLYTRQVLQRFGLLRVLRKTVSQEADVKGIVGKLALGEADAGFVYATDVKAASGRLTAIPIPKRGRPWVRYELAVVTSTKHVGPAWAFVADVLGAEGRRQLARAGFGLPKP